MTKQAIFSRLVLGCAMVVGLSSPAFAQYDSQGDTGDFGRQSAMTGQGPAGMGAGFSFPTMAQNILMNSTGTQNLAPKFGPRGRNGLPQTSLDSFVLNAGGMAEQIYGDEGASGLPPYEGFTQGHRINAGIVGPRAAGLTTGHGSVLPNAWGGDEFTGAEYSMSGSPYPQFTPPMPPMPNYNPQNYPTFIDDQPRVNNWDLGGQNSASVTDYQL